MNTYSEEARHQFQHCLGWLNQWACSRSFGLGTRVPWDPQYLVESLSDSTIYMAYYTVAHFLQEGNLYGEGNGQIRAEDVTDQVTLPFDMLPVAFGSVQAFGFRLNWGWRSPPAIRPPSLPLLCKLFALSCRACSFAGPTPPPPWVARTP